MAETQEKMSVSGLVGKAGEALVATELLRQQIHVAYPAYDGGIDLLAYSEINFHKVVPIQVKARSLSCYVFQKSWFQRVKGLVLVQVWNVTTNPEFYIFREMDVIDARGKHAERKSWDKGGRWSTTTPGKDELERMRPHRNQWDLIRDQLRSTDNLRTIEKV